MRAGTLLKYVAGWILFLAIIPVPLVTSWLICNGPEWVKYNNSAGPGMSATLLVIVLFAAGMGCIFSANDDIRPR